MPCLDWVSGFSWLRLGQALEGCVPQLLRDVADGLIDATPLGSCVRNAGGAHGNLPWHCVSQKCINLAAVHTLVAQLVFHKLPAPIRSYIDGRRQAPQTVR